MVWIGAAIGAASTAYALFAGPYLPYIDWSNHLALISVLAHGDQSGATDYLVRSWAPSPYLVFYALSALLSQFMAVDVAARVLLSLAGGGLALGAGALADACGRSPRLGLIAPLGMFGISMGYGFVSFVFATPFLFFALAAAERTMTEPRNRRAHVSLAVWLSFAFLGHALLFLTASVLIGLRALLQAVLERSPKPALRTIGSAVPAACLALPQTLTYLASPSQEAGTAAGEALYFAPLSEHFHQLAGHLLERGSPAHLPVMRYTLVLWLALLLLGVVRPRATARRWAALFYGVGLLALFVFGQSSIEWPASLWLAYPRFGVLAAIALFLVPRVDLEGWFSLVLPRSQTTPPQRSGIRLVPLALLPCALVVWNATLNAQHVRNFSELATSYDPVRRAIPPRSRVLALTVAEPGDVTGTHPALGSLYFYHMVDGASYVAFLFDNPGHPVRLRPGVAPRAPFWRTPDAFDPRLHGKDFDYLVLRGRRLVDRTVKAAEHELVAEINGWTIFKTRDPSARPPDGRRPGD